MYTACEVPGCVQMLTHVCNTKPANSLIKHEVPCYCGCILVRVAWFATLRYAVHCINSTLRAVVLTVPCMCAVAQLTCTHCALCNCVHAPKGPFIVEREGTACAYPGGSERLKATSYPAHVLGRRWLVLLPSFGLGLAESLHSRATAPIPGSAWWAHAAPGTVLLPFCTHILTTPHSR